MEDCGGSETDHFRSCGFDGITVVMKRSAVMGALQGAFS